MAKSKRNPFDELALMRAEGKTFKECGEALGVTDRTCRTWAKKPAVKARINELQDERMSEAIGLLRSGVRRALTRIENLIDHGTSDDSVRLSAARGWISDLMALAKYSELERRIEALEAEGGGVHVGQPTRTDQPH